MKTNEKELDRIKEVLREHPKGIKITQIARDISMNRNSVAKYLDILLMTGQVEMLQHGMSKIYILSKRMSLSTMLDLSSDFILVLDKEMKIVQINDNYLKFANIKREAAIGHRPDTIKLPVISQQLIFEKVKEAHYGSDIKAETMAIMNGTEYFFEIRVTPTVFLDGKSGITIILEDVTGQKKNELSLKDSEANFRTLFGESPTGTAVYDGNGQLMELNTAFLDSFGMPTKKEIGALNLFNLPGISKESTANLKRGKKVSVESVIDYEQMKDRYKYVPQKSGKATFEVQVAPITLKNGGTHPGYLLHIRESDAKFNKIMDNATDPIARIGKDLRYLYANKGVTAITGLQPDAVVGKTNAEISMAAENAALWDRKVQEVFATRNPATFDFAISSGNEIRWFSANLSPELGGSNEIDSVIAVSHDITSRRKSDGSGEEYKQLLEKTLACLYEAITLLDTKNNAGAVVNQTLEKMPLDKGSRLFDRFPAGVAGVAGPEQEYLGSLLDLFRSRTATSETALVPVTKPVSGIAATEREKASEY